MKEMRAYYEREKQPAPVFGIVLYIIIGMPHTQKALITLYNMLQVCCRPFKFPPLNNTFLIYLSQIL